MHRLNVLLYGSNSFISTLNELKPFLKFNHFTESSDINCDIILFHEDALEEKRIRDLINKSSILKVCLLNNRKQNVKCDANILLPTTIKEINSAIESTFAKQRFIKNSSIEVKTYLLDKNAKKLFKNNDSILLTEKEVQLLELFLKNSNPLSKDDILTAVWNYSSDADTHTVETHIYRLRKKISDKFLDDKFILNNKHGYHL